MSFNPVFEKCVLIPLWSVGIFTKLLQGVQKLRIHRATDRLLQTDCQIRPVPSVMLPVSQFLWAGDLRGLGRRYRLW